MAHHYWQHPKMQGQECMLKLELLKQQPHFQLECTYSIINSDSTNTKNIPIY